MDATRLAWLSSGLVVAVGAAMVLVRASSAGQYEEPSFTLVERRGAFELRDYGPRLLAEVTMGGDRDEAASAAFRLLAGYIFSDDNAEGQAIGMTIPVGQYQVEGQWRMWFAMPARYSVESLPPPTDPRIRIVERGPERLAVRSFSGRTAKSHFSEEAAHLQADLQAEGFEATGPATFAVYNGPFTPGPLRRNEVLVPVSVFPDDQSDSMSGRPR